LNDLTFDQVRIQAQVDTAIPNMDPETSMAYCKDGIIDIVKHYDTAGQRQTETVQFDGTPVELSKEVRSITEVRNEQGYPLSSNVGYQLFPDNTIEFRNTGFYTVTYLCFPDLDLDYDDPIPLPRMYQEAVHWYLGFKHMERLYGGQDAASQYFSQNFNQTCMEADSFYSGQRQYRRIRPSFGRR